MIRNDGAEALSKEHNPRSIIRPAAIAMALLVVVYVGAFCLWYNQTSFRPYKPFLGNDPRIALERERMLFKPLVWLDRKVLRRHVWESRPE